MKKLHDPLVHRSANWVGRARPLRANCFVVAGHARPDLASHSVGSSPCQGCPHSGHGPAHQKGFWPSHGLPQTLGGVIRAKINIIRLETSALVPSRETGFRRHASRSVPELGFTVFPSGSLTEGERPAGRRLVEKLRFARATVQRCAAGFLSFPMLCGSPGSVKALQEQPVAPTRCMCLWERAHRNG